MNYLVEITKPAQEDFQVLFAYIAQHSPKGADAWERAFEVAVRSLETQPLSCSLAPESEDHTEEIRQFLFKTSKGLSYRGLFTIREQTVFILHLRGSGQNLMRDDELQLPE